MVTGLIGSVDEWELEFAFSDVLEGWRNQNSPTMSSVPATAMAIKRVIMTLSPNETLLAKARG